MTSASFGPQVTIPISKHMLKYFPSPYKSFLVVHKLVSGVVCICKCKIVQICYVVEMSAQLKPAPPVSHCGCFPGSPSLLAGQVSTTCKHSSPPHCGRCTHYTTHGSTPRHRQLVTSVPIQNWFHYITSSRNMRTRFLQMFKSLISALYSVAEKCKFPKFRLLTMETNHGH